MRRRARADGDERRRPRPRRRAHRALVLGRAEVTELEHLAEHRDAAPGHGDTRQRLERGGHRRRVRVVGVVEHDARRHGCAPPPCATAPGRTVASPAATSSNGDTPCRARPRPRGARSRPGARRGRRASTVPPPHGDSSRNDGRSSASSSTSRARTSASALARRRPAPRGRTCGRRAPASRGRRRRAPPGRGRSSASSSSPFTRATPARPPSGPAWASPMLVITPTWGGRSRTASAMLPGTRAPISSTRASVAGRRAEQGERQPASLLNEPGLACTWNLGASAAAVRSLVPVLPAEPVMPTTVAPRRRVARRRVRAGRARRTRRRPARARRRRSAMRGGSPARRSRRVPHASVDEVVTVARRDERDEARAGLEDSRVDGERRRARASASPLSSVATGERRDLGARSAPPERSELFARDDPVVERATCGPAPSGRSRGPCRR